MSPRTRLALAFATLTACGPTPDPAEHEAAATVTVPPPIASPGDTTTVGGKDPCPTTLRHVVTDPKTGKSYSEPNLDVAAVLAACPALREPLAWTSGTGAVVGYADWTAAQKATLQLYYQLYALGNPTVPLACPTPAQNLEPDLYATRTAGAMYVSAEQGFALYAASVAHSLALEARAELPWSLLSFPAAERSAALASDRMFAPIKPGTVTLPSGLVAGRDLQLAPSRDNAPTFVCQPGEGYAFLRGNSTSGIDLVAATADDTLANLTLFVARNLQHGPTSPLDRDLALYGFDLPGRLVRRTDRSYAGKLAAPGGCHSAAALIEDLARIVNIPVENVALLAYTAVDLPFEFRSHRGLAYRWTTAPRYLEHTDDAYATGTYGIAIRPLGQTLGAARRFYDAVWATPARLTAAGMTIYADLPTLMPGVGYGAGQLPRERYLSYGRLLGVWTDATPAAGSPRANEYTARIQEAMCGETFVFEYCRNLPSGYGYHNFQWITSSEMPYLANAVDAARAWAITEACVNAAGGCNAANALFSAHAAETAWW